MAEEKLILEGEAAQLLPFDLPNQLKSLEPLIVERTLQITNGLGRFEARERFAQVAGMVATDYDGRVRNLLARRALAKD